MEGKNRASMMHYFTSIMNHNYKDITTRKKYSYGNSAIKSYILECHVFNAQTTHDKIQEALHHRSREVDPTSQVKETEEESLLYLQNEGADFYMDVSDRRFIVFHTAEPTKVTDKFIKKFYNQEGYDSLWLPVPLLLDMQNIGTLWGMGVNFSNSMDSVYAGTEDASLDRDEDVEDEEHSQDISINIQRHYAREFKDILFSSNLRSMMGVSRLAVLRRAESEHDKNEDSFVIDDIKYSGKITAKGKSFHQHLQVIYDVVENYKHHIIALEKFRMSFHDNDLVGSPIFIHFTKEFSVRKLVDLVFSGTDPFRLWGIADEIADNAYRVFAVDMHHGNKGKQLTFEIRPNRLSIVLPADSCTNTVLRLMSNINHYLDAMAYLEVKDYDLKIK